MNDEYLMIASMTLGGFLGALGGTGFKWARRYLLPACFTGIALLSGFLWWKCLLYGLGTCIAFTLPYGFKISWPVKFLVGCSFVLPSLILGFTVWQIIAPIAFITLFALSNIPKTAKYFPWKIVEFISFANVGIVLASLIALY
jgi:hypothetical protein